MGTFFCRPPKMHYETTRVVYADSDSSFNQCRLHTLQHLAVCRGMVQVREGSQRSRGADQPWICTHVLCVFFGGAFASSREFIR